MPIQQKALLYDLSTYLVEQENFNVLYFNIKDNEIWLSKNIDKQERIVRIVNQRYDWKNRLKSDMATVFQRVKMLKKSFSQKVINISNIYITDLEPVDDWKELLKPLRLEDKLTYNMSVFYLTNERYEAEIIRLNKNIGINYPQDMPFKNDEIESQKNILINNVQQQKKQNKEIFTYGKPYFTFLLIAVNVFLFILLEIRGGSTDVPNLIEMGAKYNPAMINGEWWRAITSMFLHIGIFHLLMNMIALYYLGFLLERIYGTWRFIVIYFLAGIGGSLTSFALSTNVSAGASGAIFGLFGALLYFGVNYKKIFSQTMGRNVIVILLINLFIGIAVPNIDMGAHLGGLITGFIAAAITSLPKKKNYKTSALSFLIYSLIIAGLIIFGIESNEDDPMYYLMQTEESINNNNYESAINSATKGLENSSEAKADLLFQRAYAYVELNQLDMAMKDLEESVEIESHFPEAYYNLSIIYYEKGQIEKAENNIEKAMSQTSDQDRFKEMYNKIMGSKE